MAYISEETTKSRYSKDTSKEKEGVMNKLRQDATTGKGPRSGKGRTDHEYNQTEGEYLEAPGGGTPMDKGETYIEAENPDAAAELRKKDPSTPVRVMQPRDEEGRFTYNSANRRPLKYGPTRGTTIPPFLKNVKITYADKGKGGFVQGGKVYKMPDMSAEDFIKAAQEYVKEGNSQFGKLSEKAEAKRGRRSKAEQEAKERGETTVTGGKQDYHTMEGGQDIGAFKEKFVENLREEAKKKMDKEFDEKTVNAIKNHDFDSFDSDTIEFFDRVEKMCDKIGMDDNTKDVAIADIMNKIGEGKIKSPFDAINSLFLSYHKKTYGKGRVDKRV